MEVWHQVSVLLSRHEGKHVFWGPIQITVYTPMMSISLGTWTQTHSMTESVGVIVNRDMQEATFHEGIARGLGSNAYSVKYVLRFF